MKRIMFLVITAAFTVTPEKAGASPMDPDYTERIVDAIWQAEGGEQASYPYGIIASRKLTKEEARRWCYNTVRNNWMRWQAAGAHGDYLVFLANRYCPVGAKNDPQGLNKNWLRNVRSILERHHHG